MTEMSSEDPREASTDKPSVPPQPANQAAEDQRKDQQVVLSEDLLVDEAGMETFPASDPPSWTPLITMGHPHQRVAPAEPVPNPDETPPSSS